MPHRSRRHDERELEGLPAPVQRCFKAVLKEDGKTVSAPWQGRFWNYAMKDGMQVRMQSEIAWILPEGAWPYFRGTTTALSYEFAK